MITYYEVDYVRPDTGEHGTFVVRVEHGAYPTWGWADGFGRRGSHTAYSTLDALTEGRTWAQTVAALTGGTMRTEVDHG